MGGCEPCGFSWATGSCLFQTRDHNYPHPSLQPGRWKRWYTTLSETADLQASGQQEIYVPYPALQLDWHHRYDTAERSERVRDFYHQSSSEVRFLFASVPLVFRPIDLTRIVSFKMDIPCTGGFLQGDCIIKNTRMWKGFPAKPLCACKLCSNRLPNTNTVCYPFFVSVHR